MTHSNAALLMTAALMSAPLVSSAASVTYDFTGTVTGATGTYSTITTGETITGTYTIDYSAAIPSQSNGTPGNFSTGWTAQASTALAYPAPTFVFSSTAQVGGFSYSTYAPSSLITMSSSMQGSSGDLIGSENVSAGSNGAGSLMNIYINGTAFGANSAGLPNFTGAGGGDFVTSTSTNTSEVTYSLTSVTPASPVPLPSTFALLFGGLGMLGSIGLRRRGVRHNH
jgi:PEP-CTERM motif